MQHFARLMLGTSLVAGIVWCSPNGVKAQQSERWIDPEILRIVLPDKAIEAHVRAIAAMPLGYPVLVEFRTARVNDLPAFIVVLRRTRWDLKDLPQSALVSGKLWTEAMKLPEAERLKVMNRTENHIQLWAVESTAADPAALKKSLQPSDKPHEHHRELFYLGREEKFAWFGYLTINDFANVEHETGLKGDAIIPALIRGVGIEDRGSNTANSCAALLANEGAKALKDVDQAIANRVPHRTRLVTAVGRASDRAVGDWLIARVHSDDEETARGAKWALLQSPRPEAADLYVKWVAAGAGQRDVRDELAACRAVKAAKARPSLERILAAPSCHWEYRSALEFSRELDGKPAMPEKLLAAETQIKTFGYGSGDKFNQAKVDEAVPIILGSMDHQEAAAIALELALYRTKGETRAIQKAGIEILRGLPDGEGKRLAALVAAHNRLESRDDDLKQILDALDQ